MYIRSDAVNQDLLMKRYAQGDEKTWEDVVGRVARHASTNEEQFDAFYSLIHERRFLPSRMTYMGTDFPFASSCFVFDIEDNLESIMTTLKEACHVQKYGGGTGYDFSQLRPKGDIINTSKGEASGPVSFMKLYHNAMEVVNRAGKKHAAQMGILRCDHPDIFEFIHCKDAEGALWTFNISVAVTDEFIYSVENNTRWDLVFDGKVYKTINAMDLWNEIVEHAWHNGDPGVIFIDTVNKHNRYPFPIRATNPCLAPGTIVHTRQGHFPIENLVGRTVDVWDGNQWVTVNSFRRTGRFQQTLKITMHGGEELIVTPNHNMIKADGSVVKAIDIKQGDRLMLSSAPTTHGDKSVTGAYLKGFLLGDGTSKTDRPALWVYGPKQCCSNRLVESLSEVPAGAVNTSAISEIGYKDLSNRDAIALQGMTPCKDELINWSTIYKERLPHDVYDWDLRSKSDFLAGIFDADGTALDSKNGFSYQLSSIHKNFLLDVKRLLSTMGIDSTVGLMKAAKTCNFNDGYGDYNAQACYRLTIPQRGSVELAKYAKFERLTDFSEKELKYNIKPKHGKVVSVADDGIEEEVYCCTVPTTHQFALSNGLMVGNCGEIPQPSHFACNLGSIDLSRHVVGNSFHWNALEMTIRESVRFLDNSIENAYFPVEKIRQNTIKYRNIGVGVMGWVDALIMMGIAYDSDEAVGMGQHVMKFINKVADDESLTMGGNERRNVTLTAIAPTGSISMLADCSSGIEPLFGIVTTKNTYVGSYHNVHWLFEQIAKERGFYSDDLMSRIAETGTVQIHDEVPDDIKSLFKTTNEIDWHWHVKHQAAFQEHVEQSVSKTINLPNTATADDVSAAYLMAHEAECKSITVYRDGSRQVQVVDSKKTDRKTCPKCQAILFMDDGAMKCVSCGYVPTDDSLHVVSEKQPRPAILSGHTYKKATPIGTAYITVNDANAAPVEVFINVGKAGSEVSAVSEALGRLCSLVLRMQSPVPSAERVNAIVDELIDIGGSRPLGFGANRVRSLPDGVAQVLRNHMQGVAEAGIEAQTTTHALGDICPDCGEASFLNVEGCRKCMDCGYSEC